MSCMFSTDSISTICRSLCNISLNVLDTSTLPGSEVLVSRLNAKEKKLVCVCVNNL